MRAIAVVVCLLFLGTCFGQTCTIQDNVDYDNGYLTMLYNIPTAQACCDACDTFSECTHWSWIKLPSAGEWFQRCFIKNSGSGLKNSTANTAGYNGRTPPTPQCTVQDNVDYNNGWLTLLTNVASAGDCCTSCNNYHGCNYWTYSKNVSAGDWYQRCYFKATNSPAQPNSGVTSGKALPVPAPVPRTGKRGMSWFDTKCCSDMELMEGVSWVYNWGTSPDFELVPCMHRLGIEFVPMQWGGGGFDQLNFTIWSGGSAVVAFNEPNFKAQSNVSPTEAAQMWPQFEAIANARNLRIGSPSAAACGPNATTDCYAASWSPVPWFDDFFQACQNCKVDFLTTHIYTCNITQFSEFIDSVKKYNKPIWLTEFACPAAGQPDEFEMTFMKQALALLDADPQVERYAWFGTRIDPTDGWLGPQVNLLDNTKCALTDLGNYYNQK